MVKSAIEVLIETVLNPQITLENVDNLTMLILPMHEHEMSFHLFVSFKFSFVIVLKFSVYKSFTSFVKLIPKFFLIFDAIVSGIILISFSGRLLLVYRNTIDFCMLILHLVALLNLVISSTVFVESLELSTYEDHVIFKQR